MLNTVLLPVRVVRGLLEWPGQMQQGIDDIARTMEELRDLLATAVERLDVIKGETGPMRVGVESMERGVHDLTGEMDHLVRVEEQIEQLVRVLGPLGRFRRRNREEPVAERENVATEPPADAA